ncbi:serine/threonine protein kinase [Arthrobacter zhangbolii]|uniref:Serine/threonine protein kinase n=1 Tax=Arthrobacter zhangbolii TaxID=2886936 RepID=A0A9X1M9G2_9MICC|nr:serine/threonine-protein kinase [Arthrobacter zhangbolii]MCC3273879.1 serine/threonine protein kinase [Arthrobacter zhangbolii]MCC3294682.1 serine/threonine protein kinase [Arthrobacter zhangbolii]UON91126.1 serine/threonine protein kinase [Arthrobacter zhangbolii]
MDVLLGHRYRTTELIGSGGAASVYRAVDENLGREVAVKLFSAGFHEDDETRRQQTEMQLLATLNHPGLVTLHDAGVSVDEEGRASSYLVMELVDGPDLRGKLKEGPLSSPATAALGADLADALNYVHSNGVIHRDVKPANILLFPQAEQDTRLYPRLTDFGIARMVEATVATAHGATIGTANYLSPEQAQGAAVDPRTDIYSLGLVLLECLTGEKAFPGPIVEAAVARLLRDPEIPEWVGPDWTEILRAMTARLVDARPEAHEVAVALRTLAAERTVLDTPESVPASADASAGREPVTGDSTGGITTGNIYIPAPPLHSPSLG